MQENGLNQPCPERNMSTWRNANERHQSHCDLPLRLWHELLHDLSWQEPAVGTERFLYFRTPLGLYRVPRSQLR